MPRLLTCTPMTCSGSITPKLGRDDRAAVAALRAVALVAEAGHQFRERSRDPPVSQPGSASGPEKPKPGSDGATTWNASAGSPPCARGIGQRADDR